MDTDDGRMVAAVRAELDELEDLAWRRRDAALSALLVDLAERLDRSSSARDGAALARELRNTLAELRKGEPAAHAPDLLDELIARRAARLAALRGEVA